MDVENIIVYSGCVFSATVMSMGGHSQSKFRKFNIIETHPQKGR